MRRTRSTAPVLPAAVLAACLVLAAALAGCGSGGDGDTDPSPTSSPSDVRSTVGGVVESTLAARARDTLDLDSPDALVVAFGSLWVKLDGGDVVRVDLRTGEKLARIPTEGEQPPCQGLGATSTAVWVCPADGRLSRIDPATNQVTASYDVDHLGDQLQLVGAAGLLWVIGGSGDQLVAVDDDGVVGRPIALGTRCTELTGRGRTLWATCPSEGVLLRIDISRSAVTGRVRLPDVRSVATTGTGTVLAGYADGLAQVDGRARRPRVVHRYRDVDVGLGGGIWASPGRVWVRSEGGPFLTRIDPVSRTVVERVLAPDLTSGGSVVEEQGTTWATASDDGTLVSVVSP